MYLLGTGPIMNERSGVLRSSSSERASCLSLSPKSLTMTLYCTPVVPEPAAARTPLSAFCPSTLYLPVRGRRHPNVTTF